MHAPCQTSPSDAPLSDDLQQLRKRLALPIGERAINQFAFKAPRSFLGRIDPADPDDPLLRQIWPAPEEEAEVAGYGVDPVADAAAVAAPGLLQKYRGRALLLATGTCAIHCRYCFRRHFPYPDHSTLDQAWAPALRQIRADATLREVILSGGDPLTLSVRRLGQLLNALADIDHVERLRIHSRVPVVAPERMTPEIVSLLTQRNHPLVLVIHANHPNELGEEAHGILKQLRDGGVMLLNQSVLLKGVNDDVDTLKRLSERLFACATLPYYLHQLDRVAGAAHFAVDDQRARALIAALRERLPGYLIPQLVQELPGAPAKQPL